MDDDQLHGGVAAAQDVHRPRGDREVLAGNLRRGGEQHVPAIEGEAELPAGRLAIGRPEELQVHLVGDDVHVSPAQAPGHLLALDDDAVHDLGEERSARGDDPAHGRLPAGGVGRAQEVVAVEGDHDGQAPLRPRHDADVRVVRVDEVEGLLREATAKLHDALGVDELAPATRIAHPRPPAAQDEQLHVQPGGAERLDLRAHEGAELGMVARRVHRGGDEDPHRVTAGDSPSAPSPSRWPRCSVVALVGADLVSARDRRCVTDSRAHLLPPLRAGRTRGVGRAASARVHGRALRAETAPCCQTTRLRPYPTGCSS